ncbi:hypothetical protein [Pseudonocardia oroxyli]|uniref:Uncharacterized protein n=1 Tax=Pseudonocardia oroxyli TaxID=366584 RepID=A0A1G7TFV3_PSEOR|nr:hypothetical protein [Pseudonocardia oroxyli]SDG34071.1 hypothetical protein SAMN05216377_11117 [Pseudonocardia oroxyli]
MIDRQVLEELATLSDGIDAVQATVSELLDGAPSVAVSPVPSGDLGARLLAALDDDQRARFEQWQTRERLHWDGADMAVVGLAGITGVLATWFDSPTDRAVRLALRRLGATRLMRAWERDAKRMAMDHMGPGFGGSAHRVRSSGHDIGRPLAALSQILNGQFVGYRWDDGVREQVTVDGFAVPDDLVGALQLWTKHLAADLVTTMSLPLPGWTMLNQLPDRDLRRFVHDVYRGTAPGEGLNLRSGVISPSLSSAVVEIIVHTHVHATALDRRGTAVLTADERRLRDELLLAAHAVTAAAAVGKTTTRAAVLPIKSMSIRHLNMPALARVGLLGVGLLIDHRRRRHTAAPSWSDLAHAD